MVPQKRVWAFSLDAAQPSDGTNPLTLMPLLMGMGFGVNWESPIRASGSVTTGVLRPTTPAPPETCP